MNKEETTVRASDLERQLEAAYIADANEAAELDRAWSAVDSEIRD